MPDADNAYTEWVTTYSAPTYQEVPAKLEQLIEDVGHKVPYGESVLPICLRMPASSMTLFRKHLRSLFRPCSAKGALAARPAEGTVATSCCASGVDGPWPSSVRPG